MSDDKPVYEVKVRVDGSQTPDVFGVAVSDAKKVDMGQKGRKG